MGFDQILDKYRKISFSERDKGDRFERLMQTYLLTQIQVNARTWTIDSQRAENVRPLEQDNIYTVEPKGILIIGNTNELNSNESIISCFESYRRNTTNPEIITFDELDERAKFIVNNKSQGEVAKPEGPHDDLPF